MQRPKYLAIGSAAAVALAVSALVLYLRQPPQMGADESVFREVDALWTAVTARNVKLLGECETRLKALQQAEKLPTGAANHLDGIIAIAREGRWQPAAERLHDFMKAQQRDGASKEPRTK